jgi:AcrR family transcriptional regulator
MQQTPSGPIPPRRRDAEATRAAILDAAKKLFSQQGYDGVGTREIAAQAGCNVALVSRYFGPKPELFREAIRGCLDFDPLLSLPRTDFSSALADHMLSKRKTAGEPDPMFAMLRSSTSPEATAIAREELSDRLSEALAAYLGGDAAAEKAALLLSFMAGFDVGRHLIGNTALEPSNDDRLRPMVTAAIRAILEQPV